MKYADVLYDTSTFVSYSGQQRAGWLSAVVLQELAAGAGGRASLQRLDALRHFYESQGKMIVPDGTAWWTAGRILNHILSDLSCQDKGRRRPRLSDNKKQSIIRDVLIAVSAKQ